MSAALFYRRFAPPKRCTFRAAFTSLEIHVEFLKHWSTVGINATLLETEIVNGQWLTSREAVSRFLAKINIPRRRREEKEAK